ncbi:MAG: DoxX family protein [Saprospiraceae bacterium]|nr:DoxX family protein [Saprospiraceae bacterium]
MNTILWIFQAIMALTFIIPGIAKLIYPVPKLVDKGMTGVEGLSPSLVIFIGISEILGAIGLILPEYLAILPVLTVVASICLGLIMIPAAIISFKRQEYKRIVINIIIFFICMFIAWGRAALLPD